jgi:plastocyanin
VRNRLVAAAAAALLATAVAIPFATAAPQQAQATTTVHIAADATQLKYDKKRLTAKAGKVTIVFTNHSMMKHDVRLKIGKTQYGGTKRIGKGTTSVTLKLTKGKYRFYCSVPGHEKAGMFGYLTVT